jgi:hypothetical protein
VSDKYILDGHEPVPCDDLLTWGRWFQTAERRVAKTQVGLYRVSTVFLGLDHRMGDAGRPLLFETMVFDAGKDGDEADFGFDRYATWAEAEAGHARAVAEAEKRAARAAPAERGGG